ncbi:transglutaminaseTgpA domain-containing protein [Arthrobacter sp. A5]|uniref:transglutaminase family protein n=1 Tax=Arthrobacter sp. A5 TaxID=576926 RepID=UPI003DA8935F
MSTRTQGPGLVSDPGNGAAGTRRSSRPAAGVAPWSMAGAIFVAVIGTSLGLNGVLRGWSWLTLVILTVAAVLLVTAGARAFRLPPAAAQMLGLAALVMVLTLLFLNSSALLGFIPGKESFEALQPLISQASDTIITGAAPVYPNAGIVFIVCAGIGLAALLTDSLAVGLAMPASSGLGIFAIMLIPALIKPDSLGPLGFLGGAAGYLLILGLSQWYAPAADLDQSARRSTGQLRRAVSVAVAAVVVTVLAALLIPGFNSGTFPQGTRLNAFGKVSGLNPMLSLGNDLRQSGGQGMMIYATDATSAPYLRTTTLEDFSGNSWEPTSRNTMRQLDANNITGDSSRASGVPTVTTTTVIESTDFSGPWLPVPYAPVNITGLSGRWGWDPETLAIQGINSTSLNQQYIVRSVMPALTKGALSQVVQKPPSTLDPVFMSLPTDTPGIIRQRALDVTAGASTYFDRALSIQNYLRGPQFSYSEQTPVTNGYDGSGMDVLATFLDVKSGYCVHYSAAMAVMAREVGIPSRIAVGYAPGQLTGRTVLINGEQLTEYQVDGHSAHAWPELYFAGLGWVPFEPTPSRGQVPAYAMQLGVSGGAANSPDNELRPGDNAANTASPSAVASPAPVSPHATGGQAGGTVQPLWFVLTPAVVLLLAAPGLTRINLRRRRRRTTRPGSGAARAPESAAWAELTDLAFDYGLQPMASDTPRTFAARLLQGPLRGGAGGGIGGGAGAVRAAAGTAGNTTAAGPVQVLLSAYEHRAYGSPEEEPFVDRSDPEADADEAAVRSGLRSALTVAHRLLRAKAPAGRRLRAELLPPSTLRRWRGGPERSSRKRPPPPSQADRGATS